MTPQKFYKDKFALVIDLRSIEEVEKTGHGKIVSTQSSVSLQIEKIILTGNIYCNIFVASDGLVRSVKHSILIILYYIDRNTFQHDHLWYDQLW